MKTININVPHGWRELASVIRFNLLKLKTYSKKAIGSEIIQPISCIYRFFVLSLSQNKKDMTFDDITGDGRLWAVRYDGANDNELFRLFDQWNDVMWLRNFFKENINDLSAYFKITDINQAISDTIDDSEILEGVILDISPEANLDLIFRPLSNNRTIAEMLEKMKARGERTNRHDSWLRIYAIRLADGKYIITGGAIKLTATMQERPHTQAELDKIEKVRRFLLDEGIVDDDGFIDYISEL